MDAFRKGLDLLGTAQSDEFGAPCNNGENIFLFLTDGHGTHTSSTLISAINAYNKTITLFTYALGFGANSQILQVLSCKYAGIMFKITDVSNNSTLEKVMRNYSTYVSEGISITNPIWTGPYEDVFGFGQVVTVSMPIYYEENGIRTILGVAGIDVQF